MRTVPLAVLCLAVAVSCRCDERPNLVPPASSASSKGPVPAPGTSPSPASESSSTSSATATSTTPTPSPATSPSTTPTPSPATSPSTTPTPSTSTTPSTPTPTTPTPAQAAPPARPLPFTSAVALEPSGPTALSASGENVVDPASTFRVEIPVPLSEVRLVLADGAGAHVPATSTREVARTTRVDLTPSKPLVPASRYLLRVEGSSGSDVQGADGTTYAPASIPLVAAGSPPPPPEPTRKKRRR